MESSPVKSDLLPILIIDDDADVRAYLTRLLNKAQDFTPVACATANEALRVLEENSPFSLILLDWMMPGLDALEFIERIKQQPDIPPIVMLTAKSSHEDIVQALEAGAIDYLIKPVPNEELLRKINMLTGHNSETLRKNAAFRKRMLCDAQIGFKVLDIQPEGCELSSSFPIEEGALLFLNMPKVAQAIDLPRDFRFSLRITASCELQNRYRLSGEFVGLPKDRLQIIRRCCLQGTWILSRDTNRSD